jgi:hypothetical protein
MPRSLLPAKKKLWHVLSYSGTNYLQGSDLYTRSKKIINGIVESEPIEIDTNSWTKYAQGGDISSYDTSVYTLGSSTIEVKAKLTTVEKKLKKIAGKIVKLTGTFSIRNKLVQTQVQTDSDTLDEYLSELNKTDKLVDLMGSDRTMETAVSDTEISVLQNTSYYISLSIVAIVLIFILLRVSKI